MELMLLTGGLEPLHLVEQDRVGLKKVGPGHHEGGPELADGQVEEAGGGGAAGGGHAEALVVWVFRRSAENVGGRDEPVVLG